VRVFNSAHAGVKKIAEQFKFLDAFDGQLRRLAAGGGLDKDSAKAQPAFDNIGLEMNVLDARVIHDDFTAKKNPPTHRNAVVAEFVAHGMIAEIHRDDDDRKGREKSEAEQDVIFPKGVIRSFDGLNALVGDGIRHDGELTCAGGVAQGIRGRRESAALKGQISIA
jgi:hypothetical protein